ncbi:hypothetical protein ACMBCM_04965, partial [Spiroplasma sp. K1]
QLHSSRLKRWRLRTIPLWNCLSPPPFTQKSSIFVGAFVEIIYIYIYIYIYMLIFPFAKRKR